MSQPENGKRLFLSSLPSDLTDADEPVFAEPWQAQAFAMTITLYERGLFSWSEWAETLSLKLEERASMGDDQAGQHYYDDWLAALELLVSSRTEIRSAALVELKDNWEQAYRATPHGEKVSLS